MSFNIQRQFGLQFFFLLMSLSGFHIMIMLDLYTLEKFGKSFLHNVFVKPSGLTVFEKLKNYVFRGFPSSPGGHDIMLSLL